VYIWFAEDWGRCKGSFEVLENFFAIIISGELCRFLEELNDGSGLFGQLGKKFGYGS